MKRWQEFLLVTLMLFQWACSKSEHRPNSNPSAVAPGTTVEIVKPSTVEDFFAVAGTVRAKQTSALSSKITGTVAAVSVKAGDKVRKGQILVQIDSRELHAELAGAKAGLEEITWATKAAASALAAAQGQRELAAATHERYQALLGKESVTRQEFDEVNTKFKVATAEMTRAEENLRALEAKKAQAEARISRAQALLSQANIVSPYDGIVTDKAVELGMLASPGMLLVTVEDAGAYRLEAQVGESSLAYAKLGSAVPVRVDALDTTLSGKVAEIVPAADPQSRTFTIKIELPAQPLLRSGVYGKASLSRGERQVLPVPIGAVLERGQLTGVFVVGQDGRAEFRLVKTGKRYGESFEILSGLSAGERVVVKGAERIADGSRVALPAAN
ncbi:MAG TPA: efflux RND transporter periplasmic adaptor subunit [Candidatus Binatia bacterium]|jgi:RND family efflux transporter MFP subunit